MHGGREGGGGGLREECISSYASKGHGPQNIGSNGGTTVLCNNQIDFWFVCVYVRVNRNNLIFLSKAG